MSYIDVQDELLEYSVPSQGLLQSEANNTVVDRLGKAWTRRQSEFRVIQSAVQSTLFAIIPVGVQTNSGEGCLSVSALLVLHNVLMCTSNYAVR